MTANWLSWMTAIAAGILLTGCDPQIGGIDVADPPELPDAWAAEILALKSNQTIEPVQRNFEKPRVLTAPGLEVRYLAEFELQGRVLAVKRYRSDEGAEWSPYDFVIAWDSLAVPEIYEQLHIRQANRWWHYRYRGDFPEPKRIGEEAANMHLIPAGEPVFRAMADVKKDDLIRLRGHLVELRRDDGWTWRSSLTRTDKGAGACELIEVRQLEVVSAR